MASSFVNRATKLNRSYSTDKISLNSMTFPTSLLNNNIWEITSVLWIRLCQKTGQLHQWLSVISIFFCYSFHQELIALPLGRCNEMQIFLWNHIFIWAGFYTVYVICICMTIILAKCNAITCNQHYGFWKSFNRGAYIQYKFGQIWATGSEHLQHCLLGSVSVCFCVPLFLCSWDRKSSRLNSSHL